MTSVAAARGNARALAEQLRGARSGEAVAAFVAGAALARLRDERLADALGAHSLQGLVAERVPSLDRISLLRLLRLYDGLAGQDLLALAPLGVTKLTLIAAAPADLKASMIADAGLLPTTDLRWRLEEADTLRAATEIRQGQSRGASRLNAALTPLGDFLEQRNSTERVAAATAALADLEAAWDEMGTRAFEIGRVLARFRDERAWEGLHGESLAGTIEGEFGLSERELARSLALVDRLTLLPLEARRRAGVRALHELAAVEPTERRDELAAQVATGELIGERLIARCRSVMAKPSARPALGGPDGGAGASGEPGSLPLNDDPDRLAPFSVLFLDDEPAEGPDFYDPTPAGLIEQLVLRATRPGDRVLDLTAGVGSVARVASAMSRRVVSIDRIEPPLRPGVEVGDARNYRPEGSRFPLVIFHPPVPGEMRYSERYTGAALRGDLSLLDPEEYARACAEIFANAAAHLVSPNGTLAVICRESRAFGRHYIDWPARLGFLAERAGFAWHDRLYAVSGPETRRAQSRRFGYAASRENRTIPVVLSGLLFRAKGASR